MNQKNQPFTDRNAWVYLAINGPATGKELPNEPIYSDRQAGVRKFNLQANVYGGSASGGGKKHQFIILMENTPNDLL